MLQAVMAQAGEHHTSRSVKLNLIMLHRLAAMVHQTPPTPPVHTTLFDRSPLAGQS